MSATAIGFGTRAGVSRPRWMRHLSLLVSLAAALSLLLLLAGGLLLNLNLQQLGTAARSVEATFKALDLARLVESDIVDAETGQRGYLLTGEARYLRPYEQATRRVWADFAALEAGVQAFAQRAEIARLRPLIAAKLDELARTVAAAPTAHAAALDIVRTDEGQRLIEQIRAGFSAFDAEARAILAERSLAQQEAARRTTVLALGCGALAALSAAGGALLLVRQRDHRRLQEQNILLEGEVRERTAALEETNAELEAFAATISHDLRAPVQSIGGFAAALEEDAGARLRAEERGYVRRIADGAERMERLIDDILRYSRLGREELHEETVSLDALVNGELEQHAGEVAAAGARVEVVRPLPAVRGHAAALAMAFGNLLLNALKFVAPGQRPEVRIWTEEVASGAIRLWVEDRGIGIEPSDQARIFRPFERLHGRETYSGSGVGLAIVRRVAERLGGRAGVVSAPGAGSRFWLELRRAER